MVTKAELVEALADQSADIKTEIKKELELRISEVKKTISDEFTNEIKYLKEKVHVLEDKIVELEKNVEQNLQYQRQPNVLISGIPDHVDHSDLETVVLKIFNTVCYHKINGRDIIAVHRVSRSSSKVLVRFVNKKDVSSLLEAKTAISNLDKGTLGIGHCGKFMLTNTSHLS